MAGCVEGVVAHLALQDVVLFLYVLGAPWAEIIVHERTRPFVAMELIMSRMEGQFTIWARLGDNLWNCTVAVRALQRITCH